MAGLLGRIAEQRSARALAEHRASYPYGHRGIWCAVDGCEGQHPTSAARWRANLRARDMTGATLGR